MSTAEQTFEYHTNKFPFSVCFLVLFHVSVFGQIQGRQGQRQGIQGMTGEAEMGIGKQWQGAGRGRDGERKTENYG
jgi:hypothetical protein